MRNLFNVLAAPQRSMLMFAVVLTAVLLASCQKDWPELTPDTPTTSNWTNGGYTLKSSGAFVSDTLIVYEGITSTFSVVNVNNEIIDNVSFNFDDGSNVVVGSIVSHTFSDNGDYTLSAMINGFTISGPVRVIHYGEITADEVIISIYHAMVNGKSHDTIGLAISNINGAASNGSWFITGDFNSWASPQNSITGATIRKINGKDYLVWGITHDLGIEKMGFGKHLTDGTSSWNYSPKSLFWHPTATGGILWIYFTSTGISWAPEGTIVPGIFGDTSSVWTLRYGLAYGATTGTLTVFVNKSQITNANNPEISFRVTTNTIWKTVSLTDNGAYYSAAVDPILYGDILEYNVFARTGEPTSKVTTGDGYHLDAAVYMLQINNPYR